MNPDPADTVADRINTLLNSSGPGYVLNLCPNTEYMLQSPLLFAAPNQEISTEGYPTDDSRATLVVDGPVANGTGHTTAVSPFSRHLKQLDIHFKAQVSGTCDSCSGVILRNIQVRSPLGRSQSRERANMAIR